MPPTYAAIDAMNDYQLDLLFTPQGPPSKDERYEQLQRLLPDIEKELKRKGLPFFNYRKPTDYSILMDMDVPDLIGTYRII